MLINVYVDSDVIDKPGDEEINVNYEMGDTIEDIKIKISLVFVGVDPANIDLFYNHKKWENSTDFTQLHYEPYSKIYCKKKTSSCACKIF